MKNVLGLLLCLGLGACVSVPGQLNVQSEMSFIGEDGNVHLSPGQYDSTLKFKSKKELRLEIQNNNNDITFNIPRGTTLPETRGNINLSAEQTGQPYDLSGSVDTQYDRSGPYTNLESCTYVVRQQVCQRNPQGERVCHYENVTVYGRRQVQFHYEYELKSFIANFLVPDQNTNIGQFHGSYRDSRTVYDYYGPCY